MSTQYVKYPASSGGSGVTSLNALTGAVTLAAGSGISITPSGNTLTIATTSGVTFPLLAPDGSAATPEYSFASESNTGIYHAGAGTIILSTAGVANYGFSGNGFSSAKPIFEANGSAGAPSYSFTNSLAAGMYRAGADSIGFSTAGITALIIGPTQASTFSGAVVVDGDGSNPGFIVNTSNAVTIGVVSGSQTHTINGNLVTTGSLQIKTVSVSGTYSIL